MRVRRLVTSYGDVPWSTVSRMRAPAVEATVKTHLLRVFAELGVDDRTRAVMVAVERGLLPGPGG